MNPFSTSAAAQTGRTKIRYFALLGLGFRLRGLCRLRLHRLADHQHSGSVDRDAQDRHDQYEPLEAADIPDQHLELLAKDVAERHDDRHRYQRSEQIVEQKHSRAHAEGSRRQIDQRAQTGQKSSVEDRAMPMALHETFDALDLMLAARPSNREVAHQARAEVPPHEK